MVRPKNSFLIPGVTRYSRSAMFRLKGTFKLQKKGFPTKKKAAVAAPAPKVKEFGKSKSKRTIVPRGSLNYPTTAPVNALPHRKLQKPTRLRASMQPGQVLILLAGRFQGKRVVFLKQLPSGLLMVTGPYKLNGVPLRRVNQAYVIATTTKVDISAVKVDAKFDDAYFKKSEAKVEKKSTEDKLFSEGEKAPHKVDSARIQDQISFDKPILEAVNKTPQLANYMKNTFSLRRGEYPHQLKF